MICEMLTEGTQTVTAVRIPNLYQLMKLLVLFDVMNTENATSWCKLDMSILMADLITDLNAVIRISFYEINCTSDIWPQFSHFYYQESLLQRTATWSYISAYAPVVIGHSHIVIHFVQKHHMLLHRDLRGAHSILFIKCRHSITEYIAKCVAGQTPYWRHCKTLMCNSTLVIHLENRQQIRI